MRDIDKPRRCLKPSRITTNPAAFLRGNYDVVIEALGSDRAGAQYRRPAAGPRDSRGHRQQGARRRTRRRNWRPSQRGAARCCATKQARSPACRFSARSRPRPLVSDVHQFAAVVNGTSNFILSKLERERCTFEEAIAEAQALGLTEPDPSRDLDGLDAADKLALLSAIFGWGTLPTFRVNVQGIRGLTAADFDIARSLDATIKPIVFASRSTAGVSAFVAPTLISCSHPLASLRRAVSGIQLKGTFVSDLFFSGPGAGPEITAATVMDDVVEAVSTRINKPLRAATAPRLATLAAPPSTGWLIRATFPGLVPDAATLAQLFLAHNISNVRVTDAADNNRWVQTSPVAVETLHTALARIAATHRLQTFAIRIL